MHIGLIGGIGPAATVVYYQRLCDTMRQRGAPLDLTIVHASALDLVARFNADDRAGQASDFARLIDRLKAAGCDCAAITSIGGHFCFAETAALSSLPLVSAIAPLDDYFAREGIVCIGLLGTGRVMRSRLFGQLRQTRALALDDEIDQLGQSYQDMAVQGRCIPEQRKLFLDAGQRLADHGAEAVVLAGTDLGLAFDGQNVPYRVIDALDVHVAVLADLACGTVSLA